jgi:fibronectin-binding autotransporter adhesin
MAIGRISGSVLKSNLTRNGTDLAFETNLLYLDVTNSRVGIGTSEPTTALQVNGTTTTTGLTASGAIAANGSGNSITVADTLRIAQSGSGLRMTNVGAFDNDGSDNFRIFSTNDLILSSNGDSNTALTIDGTTQDVTINQDLGVTGTVTATALSAATITADGVTLTDNTVKSNASNANLELSANGSGKVSISGLLFPTSDGSADQFLKTDGSGTLSFATVSTNSISQLNSNVTVTDAGTGAITVAADGGTIITMNATTALDASGVTNAIRLPNGTTAQRPSGAVGEIRYNSSTDTIEGYTSAGGWAQLGATTATAENTDDTSTDDASALSTTQGVINQFATSTLDSAWYLAITRDEINNEVATAKYSLVHNDTNAFVAHSHIVESNSSNSYLTVQADVAGGNARLLGTGGSVVNSVSIYRIGLGDNSTAGTTGNVTIGVNSDVDSAAEKIDGFALASARGAKYYISVNNATTGELSNTEALVVHDGSNAYITQYGTVNTGNNDLITLTAEVDSTEVVLKASAQAPNCRVTVYRILLADDESAATGTNVNVVEATTVSSTATTVDSFNTSDYTGAFYVFTGHNATEGAASISEVMVVANDEAYIGTGPIVSTKGTDQLDFTASLSGTSVTVKAASTSGSSTTVNGYRVHMLRGSAGASTADTVLVSTEQTITGQKTFSEEVILNSISSSDSSAVTINDALNISGTLSANTIDTNTISSSDSSVIQINDGIEVDGPSQHNSTVTFNAGFNERVNALTSSSTITVNCATARVHTVTLGTNTEFNITNLPTGGTCTIIITQDGAGSRTATFGTDGSAAVKFPSGSSVLSTGANDIDVVSIFNDGTNFLGNIARNYA